MPVSKTGSPGGEAVALDTTTWATALGLLKDLTDNVTQMERIRDTPIPLVLHVHLQQILIMYLAAIPPPLVQLLGIWVVPVTAVAAHCFWGIDRAAEELSDPFGLERARFSCDARF